MSLFNRQDVITGCHYRMSLQDCQDVLTGCKGKRKVFYGQEPLSGESTTTECGVNYQLLGVITEVPNGELLVAVDHNQLRTLASETVDPIDCSHPPTLMGSTP